MDVAGLIEGASRGEGLGNQFLASIREVDLLVHVVRCFGDESSPHPLAVLNPVRDVEVVETELLLADLEILGRQRLKVEKRAQAGDKAAAPTLPTLVRVEAGLNRGTWARDLNLSPAELTTPGRHATVDHEALPVRGQPERGGAGRRLPLCGPERVGPARHRPVVPILGDLEVELQAFSPRSARNFWPVLGLTETGMARLVRESSRLLGLVTFYTIVGPEVRAWHVPAGTPAPRAAGQVHSDMEKGFIRAEVMPFAALDELGSPARVKEAGLLKVEGRDYLVADGDILLFRFQR